MRREFQTGHVSSVKLTVLRHFLNIALALAPLALALARRGRGPSLGDVASPSLADRIIISLPASAG